MTKILKQLGTDTSGATAIEYGLILALVFLAIVGSVQTFSNESNAMWTHVAEKVSEARSKAN